MVFASGTGDVLGQMAYVVLLKMELVFAVL